MKSPIPGTKEKSAKTTPDMETFHVGILSFKIPL